MALFKRKIPQQEAMTGEQFCDLLEIDYAEIVEQRTAAQPVNVHFFLTELLKIGEVKKKLRQLLGNDAG